MLSGFSWEPDYHRYSIARGLSILSVSARQADLPTRRLPTSFNLRFRRQAGVSLLRLHIAPISSNGIFTVSSIGYAVRLRLRARLTLIRLAFPAPFIVTYTYICFSESSSRPRGRPSSPPECSPTMSYDIHSFGKGLMPDYYPCKTPRLVSCYALFK